MHRTDVRRRLEIGGRVLLRVDQETPDKRRDRSRTDDRPTSGDHVMNVAVRGDRGECREKRFTQRKAEGQRNAEATGDAGLWPAHGSRGSCDSRAPGIEWRS